MGPMNAQKQTSPAGELIEAARERMGLSQNAAARKIGISGTRWRQIVKGTGTTESGRVSVRGGAETVAKMALLVGVTAQEMEGAGRIDVAREITGAGPLSASEVWDGEIVGPDAPLHEGEVLRWRDLPDRRVWELEMEGLVYEAKTRLGREPDDVIGKLRRSFADRVSRATSKFMERAHDRA